MKTNTALVAQIKSGLRVWNTQTLGERVLSLRTWAKASDNSAAVVFLKAAEDALATTSALGVAGKSNVNKSANPLALVQKALKALEEDTEEPEAKALVGAGAAKRNVPDDYLDRLIKAGRLVANFRHGSRQDNKALGRLIQAIEGNLSFMTHRVSEAVDDLDEMQYRGEGPEKHSVSLKLDELQKALADAEKTIRWERQRSGKAAKALPPVHPGETQPVRYWLYTMGMGDTNGYWEHGPGKHSWKDHLEPGASVEQAKAFMEKQRQKILSIPGARISKDEFLPYSHRGGWAWRFWFTVPQSTIDKYAVPAKTAKADETNYLGWPEMTPRRRYLEKRYLDLEKRNNGPVSRDIVRWMQGATESQLLQAIRELK